MGPVIRGPRKRSSGAVGHGEKDQDLLEDRIHPQGLVGEIPVIADGDPGPAQQDGAQRDDTREQILDFHVVLLLVLASQHASGPFPGPRVS